MVEEATAPHRRGRAIGSEVERLVGLWERDVRPRREGARRIGPGGWGLGRYLGGRTSAGGGSEDRPRRVGPGRALPRRPRPAGPPGHRAPGRAAGTGPARWRRRGRAPRGPQPTLATAGPPAP